MYFKNLIEDTLKKDGKWSKTSLTMFSAWLLVVFMTIFVMIKEGFRFDVYTMLVFVSLGIPLVPPISNRIRKGKDEN